jgi:hypothetical protein
MQRRVEILAALGLLAATASPVLGQSDAWQRKWFWGAHGAAMMYESPAGEREFAFGGGGHWLVTGKRSALYIGFDQFIFPDSSNALIPDITVPSGVRLVDFSQGRRIQAMLYAIPMDSKIQLMLGGGFSINQVTNAEPQGPFANLAEQANAEDIVAQRATRAFATFGAGVQYRMGRLAVFAQYNFMPSSSTFILSGEQQALTAGFRFSLTAAHEEVTTQK